MATAALRNVRSSVIASSVSPTDKGGKGNNVADLNAFRLFHTLSDPFTAAQDNQLMDRIYNARPDAELLNLNPQALDMLNGVDEKQDEPTQLALSLYLPTMRNPSAAPEATLTPLQIENISAIIAQYADEPFTLNTLVQIKKDLAAARINMDDLSIKTILQIAGSGTLAA